MVRGQHRHPKAPHRTRRGTGEPRRRGFARDERGPGSGQAAGAGRHRRRHFAPPAPRAAGECRRAHGSLRGGAAGAHHCDGEDRARPWCDRTGPVRRAAHPPRPGRKRHRHHCRAALDRAARRQARSRFRGIQEPWRERGRGRARRSRDACGSQEGPSRPRPHRSVRLRHAGAGGVRRLDAAALRGRVARSAGGVAVPARLARDLCFRGGVAAVGNPCVHRHGRPGLLGQRCDAAGDVTGGGRAGGRCHCGGRKHRAAPAHGQDAV